jgi:exopolysaccharide biosynthesis polyprenyl glycosylphosphotransferase
VVEQVIRNDQVNGSNPFAGSILFLSIAMNHKKHRFIPHTLISDIVAFSLAFVAAWLLYPPLLNYHDERLLVLCEYLQHWFHPFDIYHDHGLLIGGALLVVLLPVYWLRDLYAGRRLLQSRSVFQHIILSNLYAFAVFWPGSAILTRGFLPLRLLFLVLLLNTVFCLACRTLANAVLPLFKHRMPLFKCPAVIVGSSKDADLVHEWLNRDRPKGVYAVSRIPATAKSDIEDVVQRTSAELAAVGAGMVVFAERNFSIHQLMRLLDASEEWRVPIKVLSDEMNVIFHNARLAVDMIRGVPLLHFDACPPRASYLHIKKMYSRIAAVIGLIVLSPLLLLIAILIRLTSRGPVFFLQERIGTNGESFSMYKFRTMVDGAEKQQAALESQNEAGEGLFKIKDDPRITPLGRLLRRLSLDELPQLINIVLGDMVLVGPRPLPRRDLKNYYEDWHYSRHSCLSGLTGLWQVAGRSDIDFHNMCILDIYYLRNQGYLLDAKILLRTAGAVFAASGAY